MSLEHVNGEILKRARQKLVWTQSSMAKHFEVNQPLIARWEKGELSIPREVVKLAKQVNRMSRKDAQTKFPLRIISRGDFHINSDVCVNMGKTPTMHNLLGGFSHKKGGSVTFPENSKELHALECFIEYKKNNNRLPTLQDFINEAIKEVTLEEVGEYFGSLRTAKSLAERLRKQKIIERRQGGYKELPGRTGAKTPLGFQCPFCGSYIRGVEEYYSALNKTLAIRFIDLLKSQNGQKGLSHFDGVIDSLGAIYGCNNEIVEDVLAKEDLSKALINFKDSVKETTKPNCDYCGIEINRSKRPFLSSFTRILIMRFLELLRSENGTDYISGVLDCIHAVFGTENPVMIKALDNEDLLNPFLKKFLVEEKLNK